MNGVDSNDCLLLLLDSDNNSLSANPTSLDAENGYCHSRSP